MSRTPACNDKTCCASTAIDEVTITFGKGECDLNGFWEKPCIPCATRWKEEHPRDSVWPLPTPKLAMRVRLLLPKIITVGEGQTKTLPVGTLGIIDCVHDDEYCFWVATDEGGFFGWTDFNSWVPTGEMAEVSEEWLRARVGRH